MKITELIDDCLEEIFKHLTEVELINVAVASKRFVESCSKVFKRKYNPSTATFGRYYSTGLIEQTTNKLRYFGEFISKLDIDYKVKDVKRIYDAIKYCRETIGQIIFRNGVGELCEPFPELRKLQFIDCDINVSKISISATNFPRLSSLAFHNSTSTKSKLCVDSTFLQKTFSNLMHFGLVNIDVNMSDFMLFITLNTQLRSLTFIGNISIADLAVVVEKLPNLRHISVDLTKVYCDQRYAKREALPSEVKSFDLILYNYEQLAKLPISLDRLAEQVEHLDLSFENYRFEDEFYAFIQRCKNLKTLEVSGLEYAMELDCLTNKKLLQHVEIEGNIGRDYDGIYFPSDSSTIVEACPLLDHMYFNYTMREDEFYHLEEMEEEHERNMAHIRSEIETDWNIEGRLDYEAEQLIYCSSVEVAFSLYIERKKKN